MYWLMLFLHRLTMIVFVESQSFISLPSFMFVGDVVSEICEWNQQEQGEEF